MKNPVSAFSACLIAIAFFVGIGAGQFGLGALKAANTELRVVNAKLRESDAVLQDSDEKLKQSDDQLNAACNDYRVTTQKAVAQFENDLRQMYDANQRLIVVNKQLMQIVADRR